jgi:hypothetical protein
MQAIQVPPVSGIRRWCRKCGLPSPVNTTGCVNCGLSAAPIRDVRVMSPITSENCAMVQNNVLNIGAEDLFDARSEDEEPAPHKEPLLMRFFMLTCSIAMWCGIITFASVLSVIFYCVVLAIMKAHG